MSVTTRVYSLLVCFDWGSLLVARSSRFVKLGIDIRLGAMRGVSADFDIGTSISKQVITNSKRWEQKRLEDFEMSYITCVQWIQRNGWVLFVTLGLVCSNA